MIQKNNKVRIFGMDKPDVWTIGHGRNNEEENNAYVVFQWNIHRSEPVFVNVSWSGAQDSASLCSLAGRYVQEGCRTSPPGWESIPGLLNSISPDLWRRSHPRAITRFWHCWWLFFSWSKIFSFPLIKHGFSYNTVFNGFFEDKSNVVSKVVKLGSRSAESLSLEALWRFTRGKT